jgi:hypothetical protein
MLEFDFWHLLKVMMGIYFEHLLMELSGLKMWELLMALIVNYKLVIDHSLHHYFLLAFFILRFWCPCMMMA